MFAFAETPAHELRPYGPKSRPTVKLREQLRLQRLPNRDLGQNRDLEPSVFVVQIPSRDAFPGHRAASSSALDQRDVWRSRGQAVRR